MCCAIMVHTCAHAGTSDARTHTRTHARTHTHTCSGGEHPLKVSTQDHLLIQLWRLGQVGGICSGGKKTATNRELHGLVVNTTGALGGSST